ncbi:dicarboxylate/amino acid:cation symporter [uncultured Deefgea sp.]|uniref:dicarboxylate/amino acid:cation symporter n=1 Tax=uncultured Deefgea sp. TaxID=1304914 RepID=UPI002618460F|nr:dicarboxylate/amino acid:cation symporter [uncultured Deefgea sp.]
MLSQKKSWPMWLKIMLALVLGVIAGLVGGEWIKQLKPIGDIFLALLKMTVIPVIFVSLVCGITALKDLSKMGRVAAKTLMIYAVTMGIAAAIAMLLSMTFGIGSGMSAMLHGVTAPEMQTTSLLDTMMGIFPDNPFKAFAEGQVLPIIVFAIFFGIAINKAGAAGEPVQRLFVSLNEVVFKLILMVLSFAPYGVFALIAYVTADNGFRVLGELASLVGVIYLSCMLMLVVVFPLLLRLFVLPAWPFLRKMLPVQLFAYSTASSNATLPLNMETCEHQLGVHNSIASFVLPLGATVNMNGLATYLGAVAIFAANAVGIELTLLQMVTVIITTVLAAIGAAGVPGTGLIVMSLVLTSVGLPLEVVAAIAAVDRIIDMMNTATNVSGDSLAAVLVARAEGELDLATYRNLNNDTE